MTAPNRVSSFVKRGKSAKAGVSTHPKGTRPSPSNAQLLTATGTTSLDYLLGGGVAIGTVMLVDEDQHGSYSKLVQKFFLSEGAASGHHLVLTSASSDPHAVFQGLYPPAIQSTRVKSKSSSTPTTEQSGNQVPVAEAMEIAWRYKNMKAIESEVGTGSATWGHDFDVSKTLGMEGLAALNYNAIDLREACQSETTLDPDGPITDLLPAHAELFAKVAKLVAPFKVGLPPPAVGDRSVLRLVIESIGSPMWPSSSASMLRLIVKLRGLIRGAYAVCLLTTPGYLLQPSVMNRMVWLSDTAFQLDSFAGTPNEKAEALKEYHGFFKLVKMPRLNSLTHSMPETLDLAFKLKRKRFLIEKIHLPPELSETVSRTQGEAPKHRAAAAKSSACQPNPTKEDPLAF
eukprot:m.59247 g.59247  ORF g.59247 m.59247 type:complete len:401 (-) comp22677_c0_seq2:697-1899(-)